MSRLEPAVQYKRLVKRTAIGALRSVFSSEYPDPQFKDLHVSTTNPLKREEFPCIIMRFNEEQIRNSGIAHKEVLANEDGLHQEFGHFFFEGSIQFTVMAMTPLDLDILSDSLVELLAFGKLDQLMNKFFTRIYEEIPEGYQFSLASDSIRAGGERAQQTAWNSEDLLIYEASYTVRCHGGFYSLTEKGSIHDYVNKVIAYGSEKYEEEEEQLFALVGKNNPQTFYIIGEGIVSALEDYEPFPS